MYISCLIPSRFFCLLRFFATQYGIVKDRISIFISSHKEAGYVLLEWRSAVRDIIFQFVNVVCIMQ